MALIEDMIDNRNSFQSYDSEQVTINSRVYRTSLIVSPTEIIQPWPVTRVEQIEAEHLSPVLQLSPDVVLLGTGETQVFPDMRIFGMFAEKGLSIEVMNTGALCRTFNILAAEQREVVAAILLPEREQTSGSIL